MVLSLDLIIVFERRNVLKGTSSPCCQRFMAIRLVCGALFCFNLEDDQRSRNEIELDSSKADAHEIVCVKRVSEGEIARYDLS